MTNEDLTRLKIDRSSTAVAHARKRRIPLAAWLTIAVMLVVLGILYFRSGMAVEVESSTVTTAYPSQSFTLLNATGYVVAQRKAAVASKATGRVEWLGVTEGSMVKEGEIIARLENTDVSATMDQAAASINVAKANLQQAQAELVDARAAFKRNRKLLDKGFISPFAYDT
ncbi:MAG: biotin/lipoyl-binding protein, partial [Nitrosospira sp.]